MKRLLLLILIPILSTTFVMKADYETKIAELENRIEMLEPLNETITVESEHFNMSVMFVNGYVTEIKVCGDTCEYKDISNYTTHFYTTHFYKYDLEQWYEEMNDYLSSLEFMEKVFN